MLSRCLAPSMPGGAVNVPSLVAPQTAVCEVFGVPELRPSTHREILAALLAGIRDCHWQMALGLRAGSGPAAAGTTTRGTAAAGAGLRAPIQASSGASGLGGLLSPSLVDDKIDIATAARGCPRFANG